MSQATFLPSTGQYLDPLGAAFGTGLGQGITQGLHRREMTADQELLNNYLAQMNQPHAGPTTPNEMISPALRNFGPAAGPRPPLPMPAFQTPQYQQLAMGMQGQQFQNQMPLGRMGEAQLQNVQAQTGYYQNKGQAALMQPPQSMPVSEQLHNYALQQGALPGTDKYDQLTKGAEAVKPTVQEILHKAAVKAGHEPGTTGYAQFVKGETGEMSQADKLQLASGLRKEFNAAQVRKDFITIRRSEAGMRQALELSQRPGASRVASDQALAVQFQKMLDPSSVVRESEYARTPEGVAVLSRLEGSIEKLQQGGLGMTNQDREALVEMAAKLLEGAKNSMDEHITRYDQLARNYGVEPKLIFGTIKPFGAQAGGGGGKPPMTATNPTTGAKIQSSDGGQTWQPIK